MTESVCRNHKCRQPTEDYLCWDCTLTLTDQLGQLPWLMQQLAITASRQDRVAGGLQVGRAPEHPLPLKPHAAAWHDHVHNMLGTWARHLYETHHLPWPWDATHPVNFIGPLRPDELRGQPGFTGPYRQRGKWGHQPTAVELTAWLRRYVTTIRLDEAAGQCYRSVRSATERAISLINAHEVPVFRGPCPTVVGTGRRGVPALCGTPLYAPRTIATITGARPLTTVTCGVCGATHDVRQLEQSLLVSIDTHMFEIPDLVRILRELGEPIPRGTIDYWIAKRRLKPAGWRHDGRIVRTHCRTAPAVYRLADVRKLRNKEPGPA